MVGVDRYKNAPAMQVAHRSHTVNMLDGTALRAIIEQEKPDLIIPEIEALATDELIKLEQEGYKVAPTARAARLTMDREGIRRLAAEELGLATSPYRFADSFKDYQTAIAEIGLPCVVKPVMSSSGKGQSTVKTTEDIQTAWDYAQQGGRAGEGRVIVEGFVDFDDEITLLTVNAVDGVHFCQPIGHRQENGDYRESWQPQPMSDITLAKAQNIAKQVVSNLAGFGIYGVELFIAGDEVYFSEVSPRPHDTGLVTLISQNLSEFALHVRAILGLPIGDIIQLGNCASVVVLGNGTSSAIQFSGLQQALSQNDTQLRLFAKPEINGRRRLGVALARAKTIDQAVDTAKQAAGAVQIHYDGDS